MWQREAVSARERAGESRGGRVVGHAARLPRAHARRSTRPTPGTCDDATDPARLRQRQHRRRHHPEVLAAMSEAAAGLADPYGNDYLSRSVAAQFDDVFERPVDVFPAGPGRLLTGSHSPALTPPWGAILAHSSSTSPSTRPAHPSSSPPSKVIHVGGDDSTSTPISSRPQWSATRRRPQRPAVRRQPHHRPPRPAASIRSSTCAPWPTSLTTPVSGCTWTGCAIRERPGDAGCLAGGDDVAPRASTSSRSGRRRTAR